MRLLLERSEHRASRAALGPVPAGVLVAWTAVVGTLIAISYAANALSPRVANRDVLYEYETAFGSLVVYAVMAVLVLMIARPLSREAMGFRRPVSWLRAVWLTLGSLGLIWGLGALLDGYLAAGEEQGLLPDGWDSSRAGAYAANFAVIAVVAPLVEETTYRGLGFAAVGAVTGPAVAILVTGLSFGLAHGLVLALPVLAALGVALAWLRWQTMSIYPPIAAHALFNAAALVAAVTV